MAQQEHENLVREVALLKTALDAENQANAQALEALAQEQQQRTQAEEERLALSKQLRQVQDDLERLGLTNKALEKDAKALAKEKTTLTQETQTLAQEKASAIAARDAETKAKADAHAQREFEVKAKTEVQLKLEAETKAKAALQKEKTALAQDKQSLSQEIAALKSSLESEAKAKAQATEQLAQEKSLRTQADEEGALLLAQLHQVQEELERFYLSNKALEKDAKALAQTQRDLEAKAKTEIAALKASFAQEKAALTQEKQTLTQEKQTLTQEKASAIATRDAAAAAKAEALADLSAAQIPAKQSEEESALLLTQLHQVQEELERYYLDNKDLQTTLRQAQARFGRVVSRQPDGIDWEAIQVQPLMVGGKPALQCHAVNVAVMGKEWKTLDFVAFKHDGVLSFSLERGEDAARAGPLTLRLGQDAYDEPNLNTLKGLSTSDWDLLRGLPRLVSIGLQSAPTPWPVGQPDAAAWQNAAQATPPVLNDLPVALRFDAFSIHGAATLPGYENLQIQLSHLALGQKRFGSFEFRFACNLGTQGEFGANARLEFFKLNGAPVFEQWAPNYRDGERERLDLVFVFPSTLNLKEFSALSTNDRALVLLLADLLPALLADASPNGLALNRPLEEWTALAQKLRSFVRARLDVTGVQKQPGALVDAVSAGRSVQRSAKTKDVAPKAARSIQQSELVKVRK